MTTSCPTTERFQQLLAGELNEAEQAEIAAHLDQCELCQQTLQALGDDFKLLAPVSPAGETALHNVMDRLSAADPAATIDSGSVPGYAPKANLSFLQPPTRPGAIGRFGNYDVLELIGQGAFGIVLKAFVESLHRVVAIKVLAPHLANNTAARQRFLREARALAAVTHDHVVTIHEVGEVAGLPYLVMQYIAGESLQARIDREGPQSTAETLRIGMQISAGLAAAHAQGIIHRDIKPANILLENGVARVKLTDFGLARTVDDASLTQSGYATGTPQYMAPEQARGEDVTAQADLFSLGSVLYAMCAGHSPFRGSSTIAVIKRVCDDDPRPLRDINPDVPGWLEALVLKLLSKRPEDRFASAKEVADLLGQHLMHLQQPAKFTAPPPLVPVAKKSPLPPEPAQQRQKSAGWSIAFVLCLLVGGLAICCLPALALVGMATWVAVPVQSPPPPPVMETSEAVPFESLTTKPEVEARYPNFVITKKDNGVTWSTGDIRVALNGTGAGDTIDIHTNELIGVPSTLRITRDVILRAAPGFRPVLYQSSEQGNAAEPLFLVEEGSLTLEGLRLQKYQARDGGSINNAALVELNRTRLFAANCEFVLSGSDGDRLIGVSMTGQASCDLKNCASVSPDVTLINIAAPGNGAEVRMYNCVVGSPHAVGLAVAGGDWGATRIWLDYCTLMNPLIVYPAQNFNLAAVKKAPVELSLRHNVIGAPFTVMQLAHSQEPENAVAVAEFEPFFTEAIRWTEDANIYSPREGQPLWQFTYADGIPLVANTSPKLDEWNKLRGLTNSNSTQEQVKFASADAGVSRFVKLEDFQIRSDSPGVTTTTAFHFVGPGNGYAQWKMVGATDYAEWKSRTGQR